jgi:YVTN family beta-propeller protein
MLSNRAAVRPGRRLSLLAVALLTPMTTLALVVPQARAADRSVPVNNLFYVANPGTNTVSVVNASTNTVTATVRVGHTPDAVAANPHLPAVYAANESDNTVSVINTLTDTVTATIPVGQQPVYLAVNPAGTFVYVADLSGSVSVISTATNTVTATIAVGGNPDYVAINAAGTDAYISEEAGDAVAVINTGTNTVIQVVGAAAPAFADAIDPIVSGLYLYVATGGLNTVERITTTTDQILSVAVGSEDLRLVMNPAGTVLYVLNTNSYSISVINLSNFTVTATINGLQFPRAIAINATGSTLYVTNEAGFGSVSVISTATNTITGTITGFGDPVELTPPVAGQ